MNINEFNNNCPNELLDQLFKEYFAYIAAYNSEK